MRGVTRRRLLRNAMGVAALVPWGGASPVGKCRGHSTEKICSESAVAGCRHRGRGRTIERIYRVHATPDLKATASRLNADAALGVRRWLGSYRPGGLHSGWP